MGHLQVVLPLCPLEAETVVVGSQQGLSCGSLGMITTGQELVVDGFPTSSHSIKILLMKQSCLTTLNKAQCWRVVVFWVAPGDCPGTKVPVAACLWRFRFMAARVRPSWPAIALRHMPSQASASTSCLIPIRVGRGVIRTISENWQKYVTVDSNLPQCVGRYGGMTT